MCFAAMEALNALLFSNTGIAAEKHHQPPKGIPHFGLSPGTSKWPVIHSGKIANHHYIIDDEYFVPLTNTWRPENHLSKQGRIPMAISLGLTIKPYNIMKLLTVILKHHLFFIGFLALLSGCASPTENKPAVAEEEKSAMNPNYEIASPEYSELAVKSFTSWINLDFEGWTSTMSDDVVFYFPDGDAGTRTELVGKEALLDWWNNWEQTSGIQSMTYSNHVEIPIIAKDTMAYSNLTGVFVITYFSNELMYNETSVKLRMNIAVHFNSDNLIDRIYSYYDRSKIIEAMGINILE